MHWRAAGHTCWPITRPRRGSRQWKTKNATHRVTFLMMWVMQESNLRPLPCDGSALAAAPITRLVKKAGFLRTRGRYKIRTCDPFRVREVRYLCANRPGCVLVWKTYAFLARGGYESRTRLYGFAGRCLTAWLTHRKVVNSSDLRADNGTRTRALDLGKVALYQLSYVRVSTTLLCLKQRVITITTLGQSAKSNGTIGVSFFVPWRYNLYKT